LSAVGPGATSAHHLSREFSELLLDARRNPEPIDLLIVGSGYGAAIAAGTLAGCTQRAREGEDERMQRVVILERGREYLPGMFPSRMADLATQVRGRGLGQSRTGEGLFDIRASSNVGVVIANGLGGGSLINAGVMEIPKPEVFDLRWPASMRPRSALQPFYKCARKVLGGADGHGLNTIGRHADLKKAPLKKTAALRNMSRARFREAAITVAMEQKSTTGRVTLDACKLCGDCATGCNHNAKESLDTNLLARAHQRGAEIYCGGTVLNLKRSGKCWQVRIAHTDKKLRMKEGKPIWLKARKVILAAGTLGSTEILQRSAADPRGPQFSARLGSRFSGNGDMICFGYDYRDAGQSNAIADETQPPAKRRVGPTITGVLDVTLPIDHTHPGSKASQVAQNIVIEELAVPGPLRRLTEQAVTTTNILHSLSGYDWSCHAPGYPRDDAFAIHPQKISDTAIFAAMGDDGSCGEVAWTGDSEDEDDGHVEPRWPDDAEVDVATPQADMIAKLARRAGFRGRTMANPLWRLLPPGMDFLVDGQRGPLASAHPLGGCPIGASKDEGVVDEHGQVFNAKGGLHPDLYVLDGAIIPSALQTNPALTIAAVALRAARHLRREWKWKKTKVARPAAARRPVVEDTEEEIITRPAPATVSEFSERLAGAVALHDGGVARRCWVEITLTYDPVRLDQLLAPDAEGRLANATLQVPRGAGIKRGRLRIFREADWRDYQAECLQHDRPAQRDGFEDRAVTYEISGSLRVLLRERSNPLTRVLCSGLAWIRNRGWRDTRTGPHLPPMEAIRRGLGVVKLATRAGEVRRFEYALQIGKQHKKGHDDLAFLRGLDGAAVLGCKRITYARPSNPWRQLQELALTRFPSMRKSQTIVLQLGYLAERYAPLFRILQQQDHQEALADAAAIGLHFLRMMLSIHIWSARLPDVPRARAIERLPGRLPGLPEPEVHVREVDRLPPLAGADEDAPDRGPVFIRLTRYRRKDARSKLPPIVMIHGYSASGTTFAHPALKPSLAGFLAQRGRDVWVLDLRSSCGMPTACEDWTFERIALHDIPAAIDLVRRVSKHEQVDIVAHCMGSAMLSMAILSAKRPAAEVMSARDPGFVDRFRRERDALPRRIRRIVLSQVGPLMVLSQENIFRAYAGSFFERAFGAQTWAFRPEQQRPLATQLLDRVLATLPYPDDELMQENSCDLRQWVDYVGTRHRMDALYGRTFKLPNVAATTLDHMDDFFGPISLDTVSQVIHFAQHQVITNRAGSNRFVSHERLRDLWKFPTLSIHGEENGLVDVRTLDRMEGVMSRAGCAYQTLRLPGRGHQDCLIGEGLEPTFEKLASFFERDADACTDVKAAFIAEPPWCGPALVIGDSGEVLVSMGAAPSLGPPSFACLLPVHKPRAHWQWTSTPLADLWDLRKRAASDTDWFTLPLPAWATPDSRVAVMLLYPQPREMCRPGFDPSCALDGSSTGAFQPGARPAAVQTCWRAGSGPDDAILDAVQIALDRMNQKLLEPMGEVPEGVLAIGFQPQPAKRTQAKALTLALGSCQFPAGILDQEPAYHAWELLEQNAGAPTPRKPELLLLTGDQIYADPTAGLFDPRLACDRYQKPYLEWLRKSRLRNVTRRLPMATMLDDHEIDDNWEPIAGGRPGKEQKENTGQALDGIAAFRRFQRASFPVAGTGPLWLDFSWSGFPIFMLDSRSERELRNVGSGGAAQILREPQRKAVETWLGKSSDAPKILVAPALVLPLHLRAVPEMPMGYLRSDAWDGYPDSLRWLLGALADASGPVILLSGDEHRALFTTLELKSGNGTRTIHSIHSPGLYTPYLFADAYPGDFLRTGSLQFAHRSTNYDCAFTTEPPVSERQSAGFTYVDLCKEARGWRLRCRFPNGYDVDRML